MSVILFPVISNKSNIGHELPNVSGSAVSRLQLMCNSVKFLSCGNCRQLERWFRFAIRIDKFLGMFFNSVS